MQQDFMDILAQFETLFPLAIAWASGQEAHILQRGAPLSAEERHIARQIGVREIDRVRLLRVQSIPSPNDNVLGKVARDIGFVSPFTQGMALRHGIFVRDEFWRQREIIAHELVHTAQYERLGFEPFLREYLWQCLTVGYASSPLEREAIEESARILQSIYR